MKTNRIPFLLLNLLVVILILVSTACQPALETPVPTQVAPTNTVETPPQIVEPTQPLPTNTTAPTQQPTATQPPTETPGIPALPPEPQPVEFQAEDGQELKGTYFPASINPAPVVVLIHWIASDQSDWLEIAFWLQNRGLGGDSPNPRNSPWLDSSWFPPMLEGKSFAVFTFTLRGCEGGCRTVDEHGWLLDAKAGVKTALILDGIDPTKLVAIGASIGADGAMDGCFLSNNEVENSCQGGLALSPGGYLTVDFAEAVRELGEEQPPKPAWCLAAEGDRDSHDTCSAASGEHYRYITYTGNAHGMSLIHPDIEPDTLIMILDFLQLALGLK